MAEHTLPYTTEQLEAFANEFGTPLHIYNQAGLEQVATELNDAFSWVKGPNGESYCNYFAAKATPNPYILQLLGKMGMGVDASSDAELILAGAVGLPGEKIMFTSNNTPHEEYRRAYEMGAIINLDDINQIDELVAALDGKFPETISFRYNPGPDLVTTDDNVIGNPEEAKFGVATSQLADAYKRAQELGVKHFGIHTMVVSNELSVENHIHTAVMMFDKIVELSRELSITFDFVNLGGGYGVAYEPGQQPLDIRKVSEGVKKAYEQMILGNGLPPMQIMSEHGRFVTGPQGILLMKVRSIKDTYHRIVGVDGSMANLARPAMYDSYHEIIVPDSEDRDEIVQRVAGGLCENNDYFTGKDTKERLLPEMQKGDLVVIRDTGAHGHAMGGNYNGKTRSAEILVADDGTAKLIRRAETLRDIFATLDYPGLEE